MSHQKLRQISEKYAKDGDPHDIDEFRAEMDRVKREQRFQTVERYITDLYADFPYLVRNRYYQFVPARNQRLSELIQIATSQQIEAYRQQAALQAATAAANEAAASAKAVLQEKAEKDLIDSKQATSLVIESPNHLTWLLFASAALVAILLVILILMVSKLMNQAPNAVTIVSKQKDIDFVDPEMTASGQ